jgi:hypothetical protein
VSKLFSLVRSARLFLESVAEVATEVETIVSVVLKVPEGIEVIPNPPAVHKESAMPSVTCVKKSAAKKAASGAKAAPGVFVLQDNGDDTFTVMGADAAGNTVPLPATMSLTATSDAPAVVKVDAPTGFTSAIHAAVPAPAVGATANVTLTVTDSATPPVGPFTITWPISIVASPLSGISVQPGVPSIH